MRPRTGIRWKRKSAASCANASMLRLISEPANWVDAIRALVEPLGGIDLPEIDAREASRSAGSLRIRLGTPRLIVLDTNVLSELIRAVPSPAVQAWARAQDAERCSRRRFVRQSFCLALRQWPRGAGGIDLARAVETILGIVLGGRVLPFDRAAACIYGELADASRRAGQSVGVADLQIAAIARARKADAIATRNTKRFMGCGVALVDPWLAGAGSADR